MKKIVLIAAILSPLFAMAQNKKKAPSTFNLVIGTYTSGTSKGIAVYRFYAENGRMAYLSQIDGVENPSYLALSKNNNFIYAVNEVTKGEVSSFSFEPKTGKMALINKQSSEGADPCYIAVDKGQKNIFVANYSSGTVAVLPLNKDGSIGKATQTLHDKGHGPNKDRQEAAHAHMAILTPDEKYVLYNDLGTDKINILRYHPSSKDKPLTPAATPFTTVTPGDGPRHLEFSMDHKHAYLVTEMGSNVIVFDYDNGMLKQKQAITLLAEGFKGKTAGAAIHISPDGRFLYASNRLETNEIIVYAVNQQTGELTFVQRQPSLGKNPRDFAIDPTGKFMVVANQNSDSIFVFRIDNATGKLSPTGFKLDIGNPVYLKFTPAQ